MAGRDRLGARGSGAGRGGRYDAAMGDAGSDWRDAAGGGRVAALEVVAEDRLGQGGFLLLRRTRLRNRRADGSASPDYPCDFVIRRAGQDAVAVAIYCRTESGATEVLVRDGLRPALALGRPGEAGPAGADDPGVGPVPVPDRRRYLLFTEVVAGIIEPGDRGERGIRERAAAEVREEAGYQVEPAEVSLLGAGTFPSPGLSPEKLWLTAVEVADPDVRAEADGDGSVMEEGAVIRWLPLDRAIAACRAGDIEDSKTELALVRLRDHLEHPSKTRG